MVTERAGSGESTAAAAHERKRLLVTEKTGPDKSGSTRLDIIAAAARAFAAKPYSLVNLDDILAQADVTKSAVYTHFRSKNALAAGIAEHRAQLARSTFDEMKTPSSSGFETLIDAWIAGFARIVRRAIEEGDVLGTCEPDAVGRAVVSMYLGLRQTSCPDEPKTFIGDLDAAWLLALPGFANPQRLEYLSGFIRRRSAITITNTAPPGDGNLCSPEQVKRHRLR